MLLVGSQGQRTILMSDAGGGAPVTDLQIGFLDSLSPIPENSALGNTLYSPANYFTPTDTFPAPGPSDTSSIPANLSVFNGTDPNGEWKLYIVDGFNSDFGSLSGGWTLNIELDPNCNYSVSSSSASVPNTSGTGNFNLTTDSGCAWTATSDAAWLTVNAPTSGNGNATISYSFAANTGVARSGTITVGGQTHTVNQAAASSVPTGSTPFDFDGDGKTDVSIFRPNEGQWWYLRSSDLGNAAFAFGTNTDTLVPADYTGDGKTDIAFWRESTGEWFILRSEDSSFYGFPFGSSGDIPAPGDFDGDGITDAAVYRPSETVWYIQRSSDGQTAVQQFGVAEDKPTVADFDGDGKDDIAVFRPSVSQWWQLRSTAGTIGYQFGTTGDKTIQGDYTGDGKADVGVFRPSTGQWLILRSEDASFYGFPFGNSTDIPTPGDYDGDGTFDAAVFRPSTNTWFYNGSTSGNVQLNFGVTGDVPIPNVYSVE